MGRKLLTGILGLVTCLIAAGWVLVFAVNTMATLPLGLVPAFVYAVADNRTFFVLGIVIAALIYLWLLTAILAVRRRKRYGTISVVVLLTLDMAASVVFTITTWWYLLAVGLDLLLLGLCYALFRAETTE